MKSRTIVAALVGAATVAAAGTVTSLSGVTFASFSDTVQSTPGTIGAATVVLGHGGAGPELGYEGLRPGAPQTVVLTVDYEGSIAADLGLSITPDGNSAFCRRGADGWTARPGAAVTVTVGSAGSVSYCSLYNGEVLSLGRAAPGTSVEVPVTVTLASDAAPTAAGLTERDVATVRADGGFTDEAAGRATVSTADAGTAPAGTEGGPLAAAPVAVVAPVAAADAPHAVELDPADPAASARTAPADGGIALPGDCAAAGMTAADIVEIVVLDRASPEFDAAARRGRGAGPLLVLGTSAADRITGSTSDDCIVGGAGADEISGGAGDDVLVAGPGSDVVRGDAGDDRLLGGAGLDDLVGGAGRDVLDAGTDGATCDATPADTATRCLAPEPAPAMVPPTSVASVAPAAPPAPGVPAPGMPAPAGPPALAPEPPAPVEPAPVTEPPAPAADEPAPQFESAPTTDAEANTDAEPSAAPARLAGEPPPA